jgi:NAD(P)-dependent dehydrogenase (short-subunit alcohol dehydrogenase family)
MSKASRIVVVTGGASGIGHACVERFARAGDFVVVADLNQAGAREVAAALPAGGAAEAFDVADAAAVDAAVARVEAAHGPVDVLVNCAGILQNPERLEDFSLEQHDRLWAVNYRGTYLCCRAFGLAMAARGHGAIVNISSASAIQHMPLLAYGPGKAAIDSLTGTLGIELGRSGVRVNAVAPGLVLTPAIAQKIQEGTRDPARMKSLSAMNRMVLPAEIADGVFFLCSDQARAITGVSLPIDCGFRGALSWQLMGGVPFPARD